MPSILATREEAPSLSRPVAIESTTLGRKVHLMSGPECSMFFLAMYHPELINLHEQRMLPIKAAAHPWAGQPEAAGIHLSGFLGTLDVAERLGGLGRHPSFKRIIQGREVEIPFPYIGDLLLFLCDGQEPYCVNWTCKAEEADFLVSRLNVPVPKNPEAARESALFRHTLERVTYEDAGIRTVACAAERIPKALQLNLRDLYMHSLHSVPYSDAQVSDIIHAFQTAMEVGIPPYEVVERLAGGSADHRRKHRLVLFQAMFHRKLRVDLFDHVVMDYPLVPEKRDVLQVFSNWFER